MRLLVDHREDPGAERTRMIGRLRWHLHELGPWVGTTGQDERASAYNRGEARLPGVPGVSPGRGAGPQG